MGSKIKCFFLEPTEYAERSLRRMSMGECPQFGSMHDVSKVIATVSYPHSDIDGESSLSENHTDERWPTFCPCGYVFQKSDEWRVDTSRLYRQGDHAALLVTMAKAPVGAMWYGDWYSWRGPDGHCLVVRTPGGDWVVDGPSYTNGQRSGAGWARSGEVPNVTASPSIHFVGRYHAFLRDGVLEEV